MLAEELLESLQSMFCKLSKEQLAELCLSSQAATSKEIGNKSCFKLLNMLNNFLEKGLDDEEGSLFLLGEIKAKCIQFLEVEIGLTGSQGGHSPGVIDHPNIDESESERKKILEEINKMQEKLEKLGPAPSSGQKPSMGTNEKPINSNFNIFKRELKIAGTISDIGGKDKLSFCGLIRQISAALAKGYSESEVVEAVIRALSPGSLLRGYLESINIGELNLPKLRRLLRSHYKEKNATELFQDLMNLVQGPKEDAQAFLMRALNLRQKVLFVSKESDSKLNANTELVQSVFLQVIESGLRSENIRTRLRPLLETAGVTDEELIHALSTAVTGEEDRQKRLHSSMTKPKVNSVEVQNEKSHTETTSPSKQETGNSVLMAAIQSLQKDMAQIKEQVGCQAYDRSQQGQLQDRNPTRYFGCNSCKAKGEGRNCNHCFKCGSTEHKAVGCKMKQHNSASQLSGNERQPHLGDK